MVCRLSIDLKAKWPCQCGKEGERPPQPSDCWGFKDPLVCGWPALMTLALLVRRMVGEQSSAQAALLSNCSLPSIYTTPGRWQCARANARGRFRHSSLVVVDSMSNRDTPTPVPRTMTKMPRAICPPPYFILYARAFVLPPPSETSAQSLSQVASLAFLAVAPPPDFTPGCAHAIDFQHLLPLSHNTSALSSINRTSINERFPTPARFINCSPKSTSKKSLAPTAGQGPLV